MELNEFHVADFSTGTKSHGDAIACRDGWIRSVAVNLSQSAGGEKDRAGADFAHSPVLVEDRHANNLAIANEEVGGELKLAKRDGLHRRSFEIKSTADLPPRRVSVGVQHAVAAVRAFAGEGDLAAGPIELCAPLDQLLDANGTFFDEHPCGCFVTEAVTGFKGIVEMQADFVVIAERGCDTTLGVLSVRFRDFALGQAQDPSRRRQFNRGAQTRDSRAHYDEIGFQR